MVQDNRKNIQFRGIGHTQEANRFKMLLEELCELRCIEKVPMEHVRTGTFIYQITDKGRRTIQRLRDDLIRLFWLKGYGYLD